LKDRREEVQDELAQEIKAIRIKQKHGKNRSDAFRYKKVMEEKLPHKQAAQAEDKFMGKIYQLVKTHRDSEAVNSLLERYALVISMTQRGQY
jgi:hypothetical protein